MSLSPYNPYERYQKRFVSRLFKAMFVFAFGSICILGGYWLGSKSSEMRVRYLDNKIKESDQQIDDLQSTITELRTRVNTAEMRYSQLSTMVSEKIPEGPVEDLLDLIRTQIEEGTDPERLSFILRSARPPRNCTEPETLHFIVATPSYAGSDNVITIPDTDVQIKAKGEAVVNDGVMEAWYNPAQEVQIEFSIPGKESFSKSGLLPLYHTAVYGNREYRFTVEASAQSFAKVVYDSCDYP